MSWWAWLLLGFSIGAGWQEFCHWKLKTIAKKIDALRAEAERDDG